jgi:cytochrome P450
MSIPALDALLAAPDLIDNPYPVYARLREEAPVFWSDTHNGWVLTRYDDVLLAFNDPIRFRNSGRFEPVFDAIPAGLQTEFAPMRHHYRHGIISADPPDHTRLRALVSKTFTPRRLDAMRQPVQQMIDAILDRLAGRNSFDLVSELANPLPVAVIAQLLGVPPEMRPCSNTGPMTPCAFNRAVARRLTICSCHAPHCLRFGRISAHCLPTDAPGHKMTC